jgi:hypothetical protein
MKKLTGFAVAATLAALGVPASATVTYTFYDGNSEAGFSWTSSSFISGPTLVPADELNSCSTGILSGPCELVSFNPGFDERDALTLFINSVGTVHYFALGAFSAPGFYQSVRFDTNRSLTVSVPRDNPPPAVPEPSTWALLIAGFGLVGAFQRRKRLIAA